MATELGNAYVQIIPSAQGIKKAISEELGGEATAAGKSAGSNIAGAIKGAIVAAGIGAALKTALDAGGDLQQSFGGLDTLYGDAAAGAKEYAAAAAEAGISANTYAEQAVSFGASLKQAYGGDTTKAMEAANTAILDMADNSAKMGTDITSIQNAYQGFAKQNYTMLDNLKLGYGGTKTEMERLLADAQELSGVEYDINNLGDVYDAIHVIQEDLGLTGVAADEASTTFTGSFNAMKASAENLMANLALGEDIGPSLQALGNSVQAFIFNNLLPMLGNVFQQLPAMVTGLGDMIIQGLGMITQNAAGIAELAISIISSLVQALIQAAPLLIQAAWSLIEALVSGIINYDWSMPGSDTIQGFLNGITASLPNVLSKGIEIITNVANGILANLPMLITTAGQLINQFALFLMQNFPMIMQKGMELIVNLVNGIVNNLPQIAVAVVKVIASFIATIAANLPQILAQGITIIAKLIAGLIQAIPSLVASIPQIIQAIVDTFGNYDWLSIGTNIIKGIANGISEAVGLVVDAAKEAAQKAFEAAKEFLGIESPAKKGIYIGEMLDAGIAVGISDNKDLVNSAVDDLTTDTTARLAVAAQSASFDVSNSAQNDKMDLLLAMLANYLPEIAEKQGVDVQTLYNGINRQLGWAIS